jgi:hypothetical protein
MSNGAFAHRLHQALFQPNRFLKGEAASLSGCLRRVLLIRRVHLVEAA